MLNTVIDFSDYREHWVINCGESVHVISDALIDKWVDGSLPPDADVCRRIIEEWRMLKLEMVE